MRSTVEAWTACTREHRGGGWGGGERGGGRARLYPKSWHVGPHFAVRGDLCISVSLMPTAPPGNQSPWGHSKDENMEAGKDSAAPSNVNTSGPHAGEREALLPGESFLTQMGVGTYLPEIAGSGGLQLSPRSGVAHPRAAPLPPFRAVQCLRTHSLSQALCRIRQCRQAVTCGCRSPRGEARWKLTGEDCGPQTLSGSLPTPPWEKEPPGRHGGRLLWVRPRVGSEPLCCPVLPGTMAMPLSLSNVAPQAPSLDQHIRATWELVGCAPACTPWVAPAVNKAPCSLCLLKQQGISS